MSVLILGLPRSGTTWLAEMLASVPRARYVYEPDNELLSAEAAYAKRGLGRFPLLAPGAEAPAYGRLWDRAFAGEPPARLAAGLDAAHRRIHRRRLSPRRSLPIGWLAQRLPRSPRGTWPIVKSVHAARSAEWVAARTSPDRVIVLRREPLNVIASWIELRMPDADRMTPPVSLRTPLQRMAWQFGTLEQSLLAAAERNPRWLVEQHESLIADAAVRIPAVAAEAGLPWPPESTQRLLASNVAGSGHRTTRRWSELRERWRRTLTDADADVVHGVLRELAGG